MNLYRAVEIADGLVEPESEEEIIEAWQLLLDSGALLTLPGRYGRIAQSMIDDGLIEPRRDA